METLILTAHVIIAVIIVVLILLQHGKGADAGTTFGAGNSGSIFGASGSSNFLSRTTAILTAIFFASSIGLAVIAKNKTQTQNIIDDSVTLLESQTDASQTDSKNDKKKTQANTQQNNTPKVDATSDVEKNTVASKAASNTTATESEEKNKTQ